ncbi:MAG: GGDEF domain-containing protein [Patescibacteria group bacterium]|nr:GGDEF domain-containing protein [Patescibacteria group bacterium]
MPDMSQREITQGLERRKDVAWEAAHLTQAEINRREAKRGRPLVSRDRIAEQLGDTHIEAAKRIVEADQDALTDSLTGLPNRRALDLYLEEQVRIAERYNRPLTVIMLDLNGFKNINDTAGHGFGDLVLQAVVGYLRSTDFLARYGGDEFTVVLPETSITQTDPVVKRILSGLNKYEGRYKEKILRVGASLGVAALEKEMTPGDLLVRADNLLYKAKEYGKKIPRQEWLLGSVAYRKNEQQTVIEHYKRGEVGPMFEKPTIITS